MSDYRPIDTIATAPAAGGATVTAVHIPGAHAMYVACSRHKVISVDTYEPDADSFEMYLARRHANIRAHAHATGCGGRR